MSPLKKKKLNNIRKKLDKLDNSLINIIKKRTLLVKDVIKLKDYKKQIVDKVRINKILNNIKSKIFLVSIWILKHPKQNSGIALNLLKIFSCLLQFKLLSLLKISVAL